VISWSADYYKTAVYSDAAYAMSKPGSLDSDVEDDFVRVCQQEYLVDCYDFYVDPVVFNDTNPWFIGRVDDMSKFPGFTWSKKFTEGKVRSY
jgi:hypothetical protein